MHGKPITQKLYFRDFPLVTPIKLLCVSYLSVLKEKKTTNRIIVTFPE